MSNYKTALKHFEKRDIQTWLKHVLLSNYIKNWGTVFGKAANSLDIENVHFVDCFAGRGYFLDGNPGSPTLAVENLFSLQNTFNKYRENNCKFHIHTVEIIEAFNYLLKKELKAFCAFPKQVHINEGTFQEHLPRLLATTNGSPALYFIDPFGYKGVHMHDVINILNQPRHEVLINVMSYSLVRNIKIKENRKEICNFFGLSHMDADIEQYIELVSSLHDKKNNTQNTLLLKLEDKIIQLYKHQVKELLGKNVYTLSKRIHSQINQNIYFHLIFITRNRKGLVEMKDAMTKFDLEKNKIEEQYIYENGIQEHSFLGDLFSITNSYEYYTYETFIDDILDKFNNTTTTYGKIIDYFLLNTPLTFRDINKNNKSIYDYMHRLSKEGNGITFRNRRFANLGDADDLEVTFNMSSVCIQTPLF